MSKDNSKDWVKANADGSVTVNLTKPIDINGAKVSSVTMREPTLSDHVVSSEVRGSDLTKEISLFSNLCTISPADLQLLPMRDYMRLQAAYAGNFFD